MRKKITVFPNYGDGLSSGARADVGGGPAARGARTDESGRGRGTRAEFLRAAVVRKLEDGVAVIVHHPHVPEANPDFLVGKPVYAAWK